MPDLQTEEDVDSLYAALNLPRSASADDVKRSYRGLAQIYHPDKHTDPELKARAIASFTRIQAAYEVLPVPCKLELGGCNPCRWQTFLCSQTGALLTGAQL